MKLLRSVAAAGLFLMPVMAQTTTTPTTTTTDFFGGLFGSSTDAARTFVMEAELSTLNENPPVMGRDASGTAMIQMRLDRAQTTGANPTASKATVMVNISATTSQAEVVTAAHIHRGRSGANGPIVLDFNLTTSTNTAVNQASTINTTFEVTDPAKLTIIQEILSNPGGFYVNVHTQSFPGGHIRGQLMESALAATRRLEQSLLNTTQADLAVIRRLVVLLAAREGIISATERDQLLPPTTTTTTTTPAN